MQFQTIHMDTVAKLWTNKLVEQEAYGQKAIIDAT